MQRTTLTILLAGSLLAAGFLTAAATDLTPGNPLAHTTTTPSEPSSAMAECTAATDPSLPDEATVETFTGDAADASRMHLDLAAWHGGILLSTWAKDTWQVEVAELDDQDRLEPRVEGTVEDGVLHLTASLQDTQQVSYEGFSMSASVNGEPQAFLTVHVPDLHAEQVRLQDTRDWNGIHVHMDEMDPDDLTPPWNDSDARDDAVPVLVDGLRGGELHVDTDRTPVVLDGASFHTIHVDGDDGDVAVLRTTASAADLTTDRGNVCLTGGSVDDARLETDAGHVQLQGPEVVHLSARTDSGNVAGSLVPVASGTVQAETDDGNVDLQVPTGPAFGYEVAAHTDRGEIHLDLPGASQTSEGQAGGPQDAHARTDGFDARDLRVTMTLRTDRGNVILGST